MRPLETDLFLGGESAEAAIDAFRCEGAQGITPEGARGALEAAGLRPKPLSPSPREASFLAADCSSAAKETRYNALWGAHAAAVYGVWDGVGHGDMVVGNGSIPYRQLSYSSRVELGELVPYSDVDVRSGAARAAVEFSMMLSASAELADAGQAPDFFLVDGSLRTNRDSLADDAGYPELSRAREAFEGVLALGKVVGMVEDSHATDISRSLGMGFTNMLLMELALRPGEYVAQEAGGIAVCHVKLPGKPLPYLPSGNSGPLTARWEFGHAGYEDDIALLAGIWLSEDDLLHPQLYPVRMADHLTRRVRVGGLLDEAASRLGLLKRHREMREG
jgi:hypothetical protein